MSPTMQTIVYLLSVLAGVLPTLFYVLLVWWLDRYEKEPLRLLLAAFFWGALPSVGLSILAESIFETPLSALAAVDAGLVSSSFIAPPIEEISKGLALLAIYRLARHEFDDVLDGIIYGSIIGFGFAMTENILYFVDAVGDGDLGGWSLIVLGRSIAFGFNHAMFTSFTGIGLALALYQPQRGRRWLLGVLGLLAAILAHLLHNLFLSLGDFCLISFFLDWLGVSVILVITFFAWRRERSWLEAFLPDEVDSGVLSPLLLEMASSRQQHWRRTWGLLALSGWRDARRWLRLIEAVTELAFKKRQQQRLGQDSKRQEIIERLRQRIIALRIELGDDELAETGLCRNCGHQLQPDSMICPQCGKLTLVRSQEDKA